MTESEFYEFVKKYQIVPKFITIRQAQDIFYQVKGTIRYNNYKDNLDYKEFIETLARIGIASNTHPITKERCKILLKHLSQEYKKEFEENIEIEKERVEERKLFPPKSLIKVKEEVILGNHKIDSYDIDLNITNEKRKPYTGEDSKTFKIRLAEPNEDILNKINIVQRSNYT